MHEYEVFVTGSVSGHFRLKAESARAALDEADRLVSLGEEPMIDWVLDSPIEPEEVYLVENVKDSADYEFAE